MLPPLLSVVSNRLDPEYVLEFCRRLADDVLEHLECAHVLKPDQPFGWPATIEEEGYPSLLFGV